MSRQDWENRNRGNGARRSWDQVRVKINGPSAEAVAEVQEALADAFGSRAILSPVLPSNIDGRPSGFHAFCSITEDSPIGGYRQ